MANLATIRIELIANAQKFKSNVEKASTGLKKLDKSTVKTGKFTKKLSDRLRDTAGSIAAVQGPLGPVAGRISSIGAIIGRVSPLTIALTAAFVGAGLALVKFAKAGAQAESQSLKLEALLKATGLAAKQTGTDIEAMARDIGIGTLASVQGAREAAGVLLTFKSITGETFKETLKLTQDLAAVGFGNMRTAALQLGKALEEPEIGLSALRRVGVSFNEQQKEQIKVLSLTGRQMEAQTLIIKALKDQVGGAGEGAAGGLAGAYDTLKENMTLFFENNAFGNLVVRKLTDGLNLLNSSLENNIRTVAALPDKEEDLIEVRERLLKKIHQETDDLYTLMARRREANEIEKVNLTRLIEIKKFDIKITSRTLEDSKKKLKAIREEEKTINKASKIADTAQKKLLRNSKRELEDATATEKQLRVNNELRKIEDALRSKLGDSEDAEEAINKILGERGLLLRENATLMQNFKEELDDVKTVAAGVGSAFNKVGDDILDAFLRGKAGALDFKNILRELIIEIQKTIIKTLILDKVTKFITDSITGIFAPNKPILKTGKGRTDAAASGGTVQAGTPTLVGERGPELFVPGSAGKIMNNADTKGAISGSGLSIVQNLNFAVGVTNTVRAEVMNMLPAIQQSTISAVADAKQRGGKFSKAFGN